MFRYLSDFIGVFVENLKERFDHTWEIGCNLLEIPIMRNQHKLDLPDLREDEMKKNFIADSPVASERISKARHVDNSNILTVYRRPNNIRDLRFWFPLQISD